MTDTDTSGGGISVTPDKLKAKLTEINQIDEQLDAASGSEQAGRRALANQYADQYKTQWVKPAEQITNVLKNTEDQEEVAAIFYGIVNSLSKEFKTKIDAFLDNQVQENKVDSPKLNDEEIQTLQKERREAVDQYRALRQILEMFGSDVSGIAEPKKMTGSRGKRGPKVLENYVFFIDDKERPGSSLSILANTVTSDLKWKTNDLRNFLNEKLAEFGDGFSLENPPGGEDGFEVTLPNGKVFKAVPGEPEAVEDSNGEEPDDDDENDEEVEVEEVETAEVTE